MVNSDPIILGHNQFIGINYLTQEKGRELKTAFGDIEKVIEILRFSIQHGVSASMFSNNELLRPLINSLSREERDSLSFYPVVPFFQKYVRQASSKGVVEGALGVLAQVRPWKKIALAVKGVRQLVRKDLLSALGTLIDVELSPFEDVKTKVVFLHNQVTDLALGLNARHVIEFYDSYVRDRLRLVPGYGTDNFRFLVNRFKQWGIREPKVMAAFNTLGFLMNPSRESCEDALREFDGDLFAMSTLAGGRLTPDDAYEYVLGLPRLRSIIVGYSSKEHGLQTLRAINSASDKTGSSFSQNVKVPLEAGLT